MKKIPYRYPYILKCPTDHRNFKWTTHAYWLIAANSVTSHVTGSDWHSGPSVESTEKKCVHWGRNQKSYMDINIRIALDFCKSSSCIYKPSRFVSMVWGHSSAQHEVHPPSHQPPFIIVFWSDIPAHYSVRLLLFFFFPLSLDLECTPSVLSKSQFHFSFQVTSYPQTWETAYFVECLFNKGINAITFSGILY